MGDSLLTLTARIRTCSVAGCEAKHRSKGFCTKHLRRFQKHGDPLAKKRTGPKPSPFCKRGHDKRLVGRAASGACAECNRLVARKQKKPVRRSPLPYSLRERREQYGITATRFAQVAGLHRNCVYAIENGVVLKVNALTLHKIEAAFVRLERGTGIYPVTPDLQEWLRLMHRKWKFKPAFLARVKRLELADVESALQ